MNDEVGAAGLEAADGEEPTAEGKHESQDGRERSVVDQQHQALWRAPQVHELFASQAMLARQMVDNLAAAGVFKAVAQNRSLYKPYSLSPAADSFIRVALGDPMLKATISAAWANVRVHGFVKDMSIPPSALVASRLEVAADISSLLQRHGALLTDFRPVGAVIGPIALAMRAWQDAVRVALRDGRAPHLERLTIAGRGTGWTVQAGIALTEADDAKVADLEVEATAALGPAAASAELRVRLSAVDQSLPERLDGAWERIQQGGAHASSQAAHSLMETIDWTLRPLAPDQAVLAWHAAERRPSGEVHEGRPTRTLRLRYAVRNCPEKNSTLNLYIRAIQELVSVLQEPKHGLHPVSGRALTSTALSVEGLLHFIVVD